MSLCRLFIRNTFFVFFCVPIRDTSGDIVALLQFRILLRGHCKRDTVVETLMGALEGGHYRLQTFGQCTGDTSRDTIVRTLLMRHCRGSL